MSRSWRDQLLTGTTYGLLIGAGVSIGLTLLWVWLMLESLY